MNLTKTRYQLIREAADKLSIVGTGQVLEAEYAERINNNIDPLLLQLASDGICEVVSDDAIPSEWFDSIAGLLANMSGSVGGVGFDPGVKQYYEMMLRRITAQKPAYVVQESEYF